MALFNSSELYLRGAQITRSRNLPAEFILKESFAAYKSTDKFDIFLSHSYKDKNVILGLKDFIETLGFSVYIDWIVDAQLDRTAVTSETAKVLKVRMKSCRCLFFAFSMNSPNSVWMPWELGIFDGLDGKAATLPISDTQQTQYEFKGQEYLALYPYVVKENDRSNRPRLWIHESLEKYVVLEAWLTGSIPTVH